MKKLLLLSVSMAFYCCLLAQEKTVVVSEQQQKLDKLKGTYRIESTHRFYTLPSNLADIITESRAADKTVTKELSPEVSLVIYPLSAISFSVNEHKGE